MVIVDILEKILELIPIALIVAAVLFIVFNREKSLLKAMKRNFHGITVKTAAAAIVMAVIFGALSTVVDSLQRAQKAYVLVGLNYLQASSGLNPNNTRFTVSELTDDSVMEGILKKGNLPGITAEQLGECFNVKPIGGAESVSLEQPYIATEYLVEFEKSEDLKSADCKEIIELYAEALQECFANQYSRKTNVLELDFSDLEDIDYMDIDTVLDTKAMELWNYMNNCSRENSTFYSEKTGESFRTLSQKILNYKDVAIEKYRAFVLKNGLSKDSDSYVGRLNYENRLIDMDYKKNLATYEINLEVVDMYERDMATIVLVPTRDESGEFYMSRTKIGVDDFSNAADAAADTAAFLAKDIANNNYKITQLLNIHSDGSVYQMADEMIEDLTTDLKKLAETALITVKEYDAQNKEGYITVTFSTGSTIVSYLKRTVKNAGIFFIAYAVMLLLMPDRAKKRVRV